MRNLHFFRVLLVVSSCCGAAVLQTTSQTQDLLSAESQSILPSTADLAAPGILDAGRVTQRPVLLRVVKAPYAEPRLHELASLLGLSAQGEVRGDRVRVLENASKSARVGYREKTGAYFFVDNELEKTPLQKTDSASLAALRVSAREFLGRVLGKQALNFVFANTVTDSAITPDHPAPRVVSRALRFTRKVNGRHIVDNTAYVTIGFSGAGQICTFEMVNPELTPVNIEKMVKPSATALRLQQWAESKNTVTSTAEEVVPVNVIVANKGVETYCAGKEGTGTVLVPHISFWSAFHLANGEVFEKFIDLCLDAARAPNVSADMVETSTR